MFVLNVAFEEVKQVADVGHQFYNRLTLTAIFFPQ